MLCVREREDISPDRSLKTESTLPRQATAPCFMNSGTTLTPETEKPKRENNWEDVTSETVKSPDSKVDYFSVPSLQDEKFNQDYKSKTLEAYRIDHSTKSVFELRLGHLRLTHELNKVVNSSKGSVYDKIVSLDTDRQKDLDLVIATAQKLDSRPRTCLGFDFCNKQSGTVFLALGAPVQPVHQKPIHLKDCTGRIYNIPFECCKLEVSARS